MQVSKMTTSDYRIPTNMGADDARTPVACRETAEARFGRDAFARSTQVPAGRRAAVQEGFDHVLAYGAAGPEARIHPAQADGIRLLLDNVCAHFGDSDVTRMTRPVTALLWRAQHGETGPEVSAEAIASKLEALFGFYEVRMRNLPRAYAQVLDDAVVNTGRKLAKYPPVVPPPATEAPVEVTPADRFAALDHNLHATRAVAPELATLAGELATTSYAFGDRGDALREGLTGLAQAALAAERGAIIQPVELAEQARTALAAIAAARDGATEAERAILERAGAAIAASLDRAACRHAAMTPTTFWAEHRATEEKARTTAFLPATSQVATATKQASAALAAADGVRPAVVTPAPAKPLADKGPEPLIAAVASGFLAFLTSSAW